MNFKSSIIALLALTTVGICTEPDEITPTDPRWKQLTQGYAFVRGQRTSLDLIEETFPSLAKEVREARFAFDSSALGESFKGIEKELSTLLGNKWPSLRDKTIAECVDQTRYRSFAVLPDMDQ